MHILHDISDSRIAPEDFIVLIEIQKGSSKKCEIDKETGLLIYDRKLRTSNHYPANYGFIPRTLGGDNDPIDVFVIFSNQIPPMTLIECFPVGVIHMQDNDESDEKILAVPFCDPLYKDIKDVSELPQYLVNEIVHFLTVYKQLEGKGKDKVAVGSVEGRERAIELIKQAKKNYLKKFGK